MTADSNHADSNHADSNYIKLDQFLKLVGAVQTGGEGKLIIQDGGVKVNGKLETRRGRKLISGDRVFIMGETYRVELDDAAQTQD